MFVLHSLFFLVLRVPFHKGDVVVRLTNKAQDVEQNGGGEPLCGCVDREASPHLPTHLLPHLSTPRSAWSSRTMSGLEENLSATSSVVAGSATSSSVEAGSAASSAPEWYPLSACSCVSCFVAVLGFTLACLLLIYLGVISNPWTIHNHQLLESCRRVALVGEAGRTRNSLAHWEKNRKGDLDEAGATPGVFC